MLPLFISYKKSEICFKYLRILSRMKAAYIFYFQYSSQEIRIINMYVIIHGSVTVDMNGFTARMHGYMGIHGYMRMHCYNYANAWFYASTWVYAMVL